MMYDAKSTARLEKQKADTLRANLSAVTESRDRLDDDVKQARQVLRERTETLMHHFDQSVAVEVSISVILTFYRLFACRHITCYGKRWLMS